MWIVLRFGLDADGEVASAVSYVGPFPEIEAADGYILSNLTRGVGMSIAPMLSPDEEEAHWRKRR
jgi:hypothetical protein